jgi:hypothetical protein
MAGRNSHPDRDGGRSNPSRLDQFGETLASNDNLSAEHIRKEAGTMSGDTDMETCRELE